MRIAERPRAYAVVVSGAGDSQESAGVDSTVALGVRGVAVIALCAAAWTTVVGAVAAWRHAQFLSHRADLGNMVQAVWSTTQGRLLENTDGQTGEQMSRMASHVDPILVLYAPLWLIHSSPETLILAQAAALSAGVYPVVRLALEYTGSRLAAALLGAWYLALPWVVWLAFNELNPISLSLPLLLYAIWFLDQDRLGLFAFAAVLALLTGELVGLTVAALGAWYAVKHRRAWSGAAIAVAGVAWTAVCLALVIPSFDDGRSSRFYGLYETVGGSPLGVLETMLTDPGVIVAQLTSSGDVQYVLWLVAPTALLLAGQPVLLLAALPQLGVNMLSEFPATVSPLYHYSAPVLAVLVVATVMTIGRVPTRYRVAAASAPLVFAVVLLASIPPVPGQEGYLFARSETSARVDAMREAVELVPPAAPIAVTNRLGAHLSARRVVHAFPERDGAEWAVLDTRDPPSRLAAIGDTRFPRSLALLARDPRWQLVFDREGIRVYRKAPRG